MGVPLRVPHALAAPAVRRGLNTHVIGAHIVSFRRASSTNDIALILASQGCPEGIVVVADSQTAGRGRFGRRWHAAPGLGLLFSVILRPELAPSVSSTLAFLGALATARAIRELYGLPVSLKWPNDVVLEGKKLGGILAETTGDAGAIRHAVVGVGVNVNMRQRDFPRELRSGATSLALATGKRVARAPLLRRILEELDRRYTLVRKAKSTAPLVEEWRRVAPHTGRIVRVRQKDRIQEGTVAGIDDDGALLLRLPSGTAVRMTSGDVTILR